MDGDEDEDEEVGNVGKDVSEHLVMVSFVRLVKSVVVMGWGIYSI